MEKLLSRRNLFICSLLIVLIAAAYWQAIGNDFMTFYDDVLYVTENSQVQTGLTFQSITWAFTTGHGANWHPLTWLSHMLDCQIYGLNPLGHHLTNLLFHTANTLLLFFLLARMTNAVWQSGFVAALFALHPLHVESVAWVAERKDVLSTFFWMLTMWAYLRYVDHQKISRYVLVLVFLALGLMAKPMLVTFPFVLLLLDIWPLGRLHAGLRDAETRGKTRNWSAISRNKARIAQLIKEKIPLFGLVLVSSVITFIAQKSGGAMQTVEALPLNIRAVNALVSYVGYIIKMIWPSNLAAFYPHPGNALPAWQPLLASLLILFISVLSIRLLTSRPYLAVGWFWYIGTLVPVIGLVQVGSQAMADRYTYVPLIGLFFMVAWGIPDLLSKWRHQKIGWIVAAGGSLLALEATTYFQVQYWRDGTSLFQHAVDVTENNWLAHSNLGSSLGAQGKTEEALKQYYEAIRIRPNYPEAQYNIGVVFATQGKVLDAMKYYEEALRIKPDYAGAHLNLGALLVEQGKTEEAIAHYTEALKALPEYAEAHYNLGICLANQGKPQEAMARYLEAIRFKPDFWRAYFNLADLLAKEGKTTEALSRYTEALRLKPEYAEAHSNLADLLVRQGRTDEALSHYSEAVRLNPDLAVAQNNLGLLLTKEGKVEEAIMHFSEALRVSPKYEEAQTNLAKAMTSGGKIAEAKVHYNLGIAFDGQGKLLEAVAEYNEALRIKPDYAEVHNNLGVALGKLGRFSEAVTHLSEALKLKPDFVDAHNNLGIANAMQGKTADAIFHFTEVVRLDPKFVTAHYNLGLLYVREGKLDEAIHEFSEAVRIKPDYGEARSELEKARQQLAERKSTPLKP